MLFLKFFYDVYCYYVAENQPDSNLYDNSELKSIASRQALQKTNDYTNLKNTSLALGKAAHALQVNLMFLFTLLTTTHYWSLQINTQRAVWHTFVALSMLYYSSELVLQTICFEKRDIINAVHHIVMLISGALWFSVLNDSYEIQHCAVMLYGIIEANSVLALPLRLRLMEKNNAQQRELNKHYLPEWCTKTLAGVLFALTFFAARFVAWPYYWFYHASQSMPPALTYLVLIPILVLSVFWLVKLLQGIAKEVTKQQKIKID